MELTESRLAGLLGTRQFRFYPQADSTNDLALKWLTQGAISGSVVLADEQIKGKGRLGRSWYTPPGTALIVSVILKPAAQHLPRVTMLGALVIAEMLEAVGTAHVGIKWPNDVQLNGQKVSGVLPEAVWEGKELRGVVLGMGINVRIDFTNTELADRAVSIEPFLGHPVDRADLLVKLLSRIDYWSPQLGTSELFRAWESRLTTLGHEISLQNGGQLVHGKAESVDEDGALLVRDITNEFHRILAGDIALGR